MLFVILTDKGQYKIDIYIDLLNQIHLEDDIFVDMLCLVLLRPEFVVEVDIGTMVVLHVALGQNFASGKRVECR